MKSTREIIDRAGSARRYTDEGYLVVTARIARTGIQEYNAYELGLEDGDPMRVVRVYRPPEQVFDPEAMRSFENKPVTNDHPQQGVDASNWKQLSVGFARDVRRQGDYLVADLIITDADAIAAVEAGKVELSNGYRVNYDFKPGTTPDGEPYDAVQTNIRGNHVAIVDAARCGPACRVSDTNPNPKGNSMADRKVTIDGIPFDLPEAAAAAVDKLIADRDAARKASNDAAEALATATATHATALAAKDSEIAVAKKDAITPDQRDALVADWAKLIESAARLVPGFDHKGKTCDAIRREVLTKAIADAGKKPIIDAALAGRTIDAADGDTVKLAFSVLAASAPVPAAGARDAAIDPVAAALAGAGGGGGTTDAAGTTQPVLVGRDAMLARFAEKSAGR